MFIVFSSHHHPHTSLNVPFCFIVFCFFLLLILFAYLISVRCWHLLAKVFIIRLTRMAHLFSIMSVLAVDGRGLPFFQVCWWTNSPVTIEHNRKIKSQTQSLPVEKNVPRLIRCVWSINSLFFIICVPDSPTQWRHQRLCLSHSLFVYSIWDISKCDQGRWWWWKKETNKKKKSLNLLDCNRNCHHHSYSNLSSDGQMKCQKARSRTFLPSSTLS